MESVRADIRANTHALYRFYSASGELLYVGITNDPDRRFSRHGSEKPWWCRVADIKIERFASREELAQAEVRAIETEHPRYNRAHAAGIAEELRPAVRGHAMWPDASRFGNEPPHHHPDQPQPKPKLAMPLPCPGCCSYRVYQDADDRWKPIADTTRCNDCGATWTDTEWRQATLGF